MWESVENQGKSTETWASVRDGDKRLYEQDDIKKGEIVRTF